MIVQPASTNPRGPVRRALRAIGLATPAILLVAIVGAGLAGPKPEPMAPVGTDAPGASGGAAAEGRAGSPTPVLVPAGPGPGFPTVAAGLSVLSIPEAQGTMATSPGRPLAVAGYLDRVLPAAECPASAGDTRGLLSPLCERRARLVVASDAANSRAHLHLRIPPGVRLPSAFEDATPDTPMRVVIVGRGERPDAPCNDTERGCGDRLIADLVAWADGSPSDPGPVFDAGLEVPPPAIAYRHLESALSLVVGPSGTVLISAVVRPRTVAAIDPDAGAALAAGPAPRGLVWYVRGLATAYGPGRFPVGDYPPRVLWVLLDETTGEALATGVVTPSDDAASIVPPGDGFPPTIAGLSVGVVETALDDARTGARTGLVAVAGYLRAWADPRACRLPIPGLPAGGCERTAILARHPWSEERSGTDLDDGTYLHAAIPPGVLVPDRAIGLASSPLAPPPAVVVIGRFVADPGCAGDATGCAAPFTIERVAWASGRRLDLGRQVASPLAVAPDDPVVAGPELAAGRAPGPVTTLLRLVLVERASLAQLDEVAASAVSAAGPGARGPVWYVRGLEIRTGTPSTPPYVRPTSVTWWAVVDRASGIVLAEGEEAAPPVASSDARG